MRLAALVLALFSSALLAQDLRDRALRQQKEELEQKRQQAERDRSVAEQQKPDIAKPVEKKRDPKACESARINYQTSCGSQIAPKTRSPSCRDAEIFIRQVC